ncbi:MAG: hypothetical protein B7Z78_03410 [Rhodospirillales bacterium 20-60-12]|nr:MAG: hypothetical protein B7Z78_03410 [Rhodospirillales bacterium 20-60-12]
MMVIFNPVAGRRRAAYLWRVLDILVESGIRVSVAETQYAGHATELARMAALSNAPMVVAAGGDGTIAEVTNGLIGSDTALGVIPLGTANVLAYEYQLPRTARAIAAALAYRRTTKLWPGLATLPHENHVFVQMFGVGFDGAVVHGINSSVKRALGKGAYVLQSLWQSMRYRFPVVRLTIDGQDHEACSVIISKGRLYGGNYILAPRAVPSMPGFQVILFKNPGMMNALLAGAALPLGLTSRCPGVEIRAASEIHFSTNDRSLFSQTDGDRLATTPSWVTNAAMPIELITG